MLIAMAGLPASGKSAVAQRLAPLLPAVLLDKDQIRAALFPPGEIEYSTRQNDFCLRIMVQVAGYILASHPEKFIIIDGRPFSRRYQVDELVRAAAELTTPLKIIECVCSEEAARQRLERAVAEKEHVASDRNFTMYLAVKAAWEPIVQPKLVVNTEADLAECVQRCLDYIRA